MKSIISYYIIIGTILFSCNNNHVTNKYSLLPSDSLATESTKELFQFLKDVAATGVMVGQQDAVAYGIGWRKGEFRSDVQDVCGDYPAVFGWDLGHISDTMNIDSVSFDKMKGWIKEVDRRNGINTISWHFRNPLHNSSAWDTTKVVSILLPGGKLNNRYNIILDSVALFLNDLEDNEGNKIPVIFRPYHEQNGWWFWWGSETTSPEEYINLFRYTVDYFRKEKGLHHILYAFSPNIFSSREEYLKTYPGDEYIDILGFDHYSGYSNLSNDSSSMINEISIIAELAQEKNKVAAFTETGYGKIPYNEWWTKHLAEVLFNKETKGKISYVHIWRNSHLNHFYMPYPGHESVPDFLKFYKMPETLFLNDMEK